jgi:hypothetical protein
MRPAAIDFDRRRGVTISCTVGLIHESKNAQTIDKNALAIPLSRLGRLHHGLLRLPVALALQRRAHLLERLERRLVGAAKSQVENPDIAR